MKHILLFSILIVAPSLAVAVQKEKKKETDPAKDRGCCVVKCSASKIQWDWSDGAVRSVCEKNATDLACEWDFFKDQTCADAKKQSESLGARAVNAPGTAIHLSSMATPIQKADFSHRSRYVNDSMGNGSHAFIVEVDNRVDERLRCVTDITAQTADGRYSTSITAFVGAKAKRREVARIQQVMGGGEYSIECEVDPREIR